MSKILQLAQEIDEELENLHHQAGYLAYELAAEKNKNRQFLMKLKDLIVLVDDYEAAHDECAETKMEGLYRLVCRPARLR